MRRSLGIVLQDTNLFTGTIRDNIRYGNLEATDQEIEAAAQLAGADDFIRRLPDGYDTVIDGDGGLSLIHISSASYTGRWKQCLSDRSGPSAGWHVSGR